MAMEALESLCPTMVTDDLKLSSVMLEICRLKSMAIRWLHHDLRRRVDDEDIIGGLYDII
jgi:hypothetical protein